MPTIMPTDSNDNVIPALRLKQGGAHQISATASSARNTSAFDPQTRIVSIYATVPVYVNVGDSSVTADTGDHFFPAGLYYDVAIGGEKTSQSQYIAVLAASDDGDVYISEKE